MFKLTKIQFCKICLLYILLILTAVACNNFKKLFGPAKKRPFQCYDEALNKPFVPFDTITSTELHILGIYLPIVVLVGCELLSGWLQKESVKNSNWLLKFILRCTIILTLFLIGLAVERLFKNVAKLKMARLRPNFLEVCDPVNVDGYGCHHLDDTFSMTQYECSSNTYPSWAISTAFRSFPSGHTSLTSYAMVFLMCYLHLLSPQLRHGNCCSILGIQIVQTLCLFVIVFVGMSRILDFRHHLSDVIAGFAFGSCFAIIVTTYLKGQLDNINKWIKEVIDDKKDDGENNKNSSLKENPYEKEESCTIELGTM